VYRTGRGGSYYPGKPSRDGAKTAMLLGPFANCHLPPAAKRSRGRKSIQDIVMFRSALETIGARRGKPCALNAVSWNCVVDHAKPHTCSLHACCRRRAVTARSRAALPTSSPPGRPAPRPEKPRACTSKRTTIGLFQAWGVKWFPPAFRWYQEERMGHREGNSNTSTILIGLASKNVRTQKGVIFEIWNPSSCSRYDGPFLILPRWKDLSAGRPTVSLPLLIQGLRISRWTFGGFMSFSRYAVGAHCTTRLAVGSSTKISYFCSFPIPFNSFLGVLGPCKFLPRWMAVGCSGNQHS